MNWFKRAQAGSCGDVIFNQLYQAQYNPTSSSENLATRFVGTDPRDLQQGLSYAQAKLMQINGNQPLNEAQQNIIGQLQSLIFGVDPSAQNQQTNQEAAQNELANQDGSSSIGQDSAPPSVSPVV